MDAPRRNLRRDPLIQWGLPSLAGLGAGAILFVIAFAEGQLSGGLSGLTLLGLAVSLTQWWVFGRQVRGWPVAGFVSFWVAALCFVVMVAIALAFLGTPPVSGVDELVAWFTSTATTIRIAAIGGIGGGIIGLVMGMVKGTVWPWPPIQKMGRWVLAQVVGGVLDGGLFACLLWTLGDPVQPADVYFKLSETLFMAAFTPLFCALLGPFKSMLSGAVLVGVLKECSAEAERNR